MANVNFEVKAKFYIQENSETEKDSTFSKLVKQHGELNEFDIKMCYDINDPLSKSVAFHLNTDNLSSGSLSITHDKDKIHVDCDAIFKLAIKSEYVSDSKSKKINWLFGGIDGIYGIYDVNGLKEHVHKYYHNRMKKDVEDKYYFVDVKCS